MRHQIFTLQRYFDRAQAGRQQLSIGNFRSRVERRKTVTRATSTLAKLDGKLLELGFMNDPGRVNCSPACGRRRGMVG